MADYSYEETDFIGLGSPPTASINIQGLEQQVLASDISSAGLSYINQDGPSVIFTFDQSLSTGSPNEVLMLNEIVATHDGTFIRQATGDTILSYSFADKDGTPLKTYTCDYTRVATIIFEGTDFYDATPANVKVSGYVEGDDTTGSVRLYDLTNDVILGEATINSTSEQLTEISTSEWPEEQATIELQMKRTSGCDTGHVVVTTLQILF